MCNFIYRSTSQAFVKTPKYEAIGKCDLKKISCDVDLTNEQQDLYEANKSAKQPDHRENYIHEGVHPLCPNKGNEYPQSKYRAFKKESSPVNEAKIECFNIRKDSNEISVNKENPSKNLDAKITYFSNENNLPPFQKCNTTSYESNQSFKFNNKFDKSNPCFHDLSKNVHMHEERVTSQSENMYNSSQRAAFSNNSSSYVNVGFNMFKLTDLLYYNANLMQDHQLFEFASAVKSKILEKIDKFQNPEKEELEFLCEITDGDQSEKNQRIITARTCHIVRNVIDKFPYLLDTIETQPSSQTLLYQTVPNLHGITNGHYSNYESPVFEIVQNTKMLVTSTKDYNLMAGIAQNGKYIIPKGISDSLDIMDSYDYRDNCEVKNCKTINVKNISIDTPLTTEDEDIDEESSKYCYSTSTNSEICTPAQNFSFDEENSIFYAFNLDNLLKYDVHAMHGNLVFDYGFSMKKRILENIHQFKNSYKEKLKFLCELTDGTQRVENQKLINARMLDLINDFKYEISDNHRQDSKKISRNIHPFQSHYENEIVHEHSQNSDDQSRSAHTKKLHYEEERLHEHRQNFSDEQSRNVHQKRSHYKDEIVHEHRKNFSNGQPNDVHLRRSHYKDEMVQNFSDRQSRNVHEHRQSFSDGQSRSVHQKKLHYEDARRR